MEVCDICKRTFKTGETLRKHKTKFHSLPINLKIRQPYEEMSNAEIAARYLKRRKGNLDEDTYKKLKLKLKDLERFRPKPYDRKSSSDVESPVGPAMSKPPPITKRKRNRGDEDKPTPKARRITSPPSSEDSNVDSESDDDDSEDDELKRRDELSRDYINCVTVERFVQVRNLIRDNDFDALAGDVNLVNALQVIIKGVLEGFIPICSVQRMVITPELKFLMQSFSRYGSPEMILKHRDDLKVLFEILGKSVKFVVDTFNRFGI